MKTGMKALQVIVCSGLGDLQVPVSSFLNPASGEVAQKRDAKVFVDFFAPVRLRAPL